MIDRFYTMPFKILRDGQQVDIGGAISDEDLTDAGSFKGYIEPITGNERILNSKKESRSTHRLYCDLSTIIRETDKIEIAGVQYEVVFVSDHTIGANPHKETELELLK